MITRVNTVDKFSTFLSIVDSYSFILKWQTDSKLRKNIEKISDIKTINTEILASDFLTTLRLNYDQILQYHLTSYLQEVCYWVTKCVYSRLSNTVKSLTLEDGFLVANEATIQPEKLLRKYQVNGGSQITTYAQRRLKTVVPDKIYISRGWKFLSNWGLLKKIAKSKREKILTKIGGLTDNKLSEYLLAWQCFVDNYISASPNKNKSLSPPNLQQLSIMTQQYNLLAKKLVNIPSKLTVEEFKTRVEFCGEKARLFVNPITINYGEDTEFCNTETPQDYLTKIEKKNTEKEINHILNQAFNEINIESQAIFYLCLGLDLTQQKTIDIINKTYLNFIKEQYQLSREILKVKKYLLDRVVKYQLGEKHKITNANMKPLIQPLEQWLSEYIESQILWLCQESYQQIDNEQKNSLKENYLQSFSDSDNAFIETKIYPQLIDNLREQLESKLNLKLGDDTIINNNLSLWLEKFLHQNFNQIY
ncbi:hypothetical protein [Geminocystis sp. GBBB08]|uniref:hypothetical protein n=1 Tax=Geminocystis sp. GBBB08 TaxID=2604140 RepID=UPI0027E2A517|nr:hypothetical protein [Geminocystis sp. GBBB08]MBL1208909.1 hypothetical protein [Geminocystis sp. GBBB08]